MNPWIILDRDGVINETRNGQIAELSEWSPLPGSIEAIVGLSRKGFNLVVAVNLAGLARGVFSAKAVEANHLRLRQQVELMGGKLEGIYYCPHCPEDCCNCRKPRTGMLDAIEKDFNIDLQGAYMVGDGLNDLRAARAKGCKPVLVRTGRGVHTETSTLLWPKYGENVTIYNDLADFAKTIMSKP